jgi:hypothetical protein
MVTITITFTCLDCLDIKHTVFRTFTGDSKEDVGILIEEFVEDLDNAGWIVIKAEIES